MPRVRAFFGVWAASERIGLPCNLGRLCTGSEYIRAECELHRAATEVESSMRSSEREIMNVSRHNKLQTAAAKAGEHWRGLYIQQEIVSGSRDKQPPAMSPLFKHKDYSVII